MKISRVSTACKNNKPEIDMTHNELRDRLLGMDDERADQVKAPTMGGILSDLGIIFAEDPRGMWQFLEGSAKRAERKQNK